MLHLRRRDVHYVYVDRSEHDCARRVALSPAVTFSLVCRLPGSTTRLNGIEVDLFCLEMFDRPFQVFRFTQEHISMKRKEECP